MAKTLYVVSTEPLSGKSAISLALTMGFRDKGLAVRYMKPIGASLRRCGDDFIDEDAYFAWQVLGTEADWDLASPVLLTQELMEASLHGPVSGLEEKIMDALARLSEGQDLIIMEALSGLYSGMALGLPVRRIAELTDAKVLAVIAHHPNPDLDGMLAVRDACGDFGQRLAGIVINGTPPRLVESLTERIKPFVEYHGLPFYGVLYRDKLLRSVSVAELVEELHGKVLCGHEGLDEMVETFMLGAMGGQAALRHFQSTPNKAVITGGDRSDIHLAALQTSTRCLILTGNLRPNVRVLGLAAEQGVPVILVRDDTLTTTERVEAAIGHVRLSSPKQVARLKETIGEYQPLVDGLYAKLF
jgi:BioD-like phosphotransacetylase family protein